MAKKAYIVPTIVVEKIENDVILAGSGSGSDPDYNTSGNGAGGGNEEEDTGTGSGAKAFQGDFAWNEEFEYYIDL